MLSARAVLCLALLAASAGAAQVPEEVPPLPPEVEHSPPPLVPAAEQPEAPPAQEPEPGQGESIPYQYTPQHTPRDRFPMAARLGLEFLGGTVGGVFSGLIGAIFGSALAGDCSDYGTCLLTQLAVPSAAILLGAPFGVRIVGSILGGHGTYWHTFLGMLAGSLAGALSLALFADPEDEIALIPLASLPVIGCVVGYELSAASYTAHEPMPGTAPASTPPVQLMPMVGMTLSGTVLGGLAGRF